MAVGTRMQQRRATAAVWNASGYVLAAGELGVATDAGIIKIGDGVNVWSAIDPAFDGLYLPILGEAANSALLGGISAASFVKVSDTDVNATANTYAKRTADGGLNVTDANTATEATSFQQMNAAIAAAKPLQVSQTVTAAVTLALTDANSIVFVNQASLTAQVQVTVPPNATVAFPIGTVIQVTARGLGGAKIIAGAGVTINGATNAMPDWGTVRLVKFSTNTWFGITLNAGKRLPKIRATHTSSLSFATGGAGFTCIPYQTLDTTVDFYNPDNEWFSVPGSGLATARRIIVNKDGEYLINANIIPANGQAASQMMIGKLINDNTLTGATYLSNGAVTAVGHLSARVRLAAGETVGAAYSPASTNTSQVDGTNGWRADFSITRLSD